MTNGELLNMLTNRAKEFRKDKTALTRNSHLTKLEQEPDSDMVDGVLVGFINYIAACCGGDLGLRVEDLNNYENYI